MRFKVCEELMQWKKIMILEIYSTLKRDKLDIKSFAQIGPGKNLNLIFYYSPIFFILNHSLMSLFLWL